jgi:hypothetical protein
LKILLLMSPCLKRFVNTAAIEYFLVIKEKSQSR